MESDFVCAEDYFERGKDFVILEKYSEAIEDLTKAIKIFLEDEFHHEKFFMAYYARGIAYKKLKKYSEAMQDFWTALDFNSSSAEARNNLKICQQILFGYDDYVKYDYEVEKEYEFKIEKDFELC
ncbi:MAG: hypothetical protein IK062_04025 [Selenomonadaceae bacterium]|nr:hypothetical protein [Selenomonadaceae bacterium]